jgi:hypothetical protein
MSRLFLTSVAVTVLVLTGLSPREAPAGFDPIEAYENRSIEGWTVLVNRGLLVGEPDLAGRTLDLLRFQLYQVARRVPPRALAHLRTIRIWVEEQEPHHPCMAYHPDPRWLESHGMNPEKARCVEVANVRNFLRWTLDQPWMVLHELAHGYHDQFLDGGFANAEIQRAFERARAAGTYDSVLHGNGHDARAYALKNPMEYFAEASEAYFGTNDFYPFVRSELQRHDPALHDLLGTLWLVGPRVPATAPSPLSGRPRLVVLTDISSLTPGVAEPDDGQSLIRLMLYTNELEVEGLFATANLGHADPEAVRPDLIAQVVEAYGRVQPSLRGHDDRFPAPAALAECIKAGQPHAGPRIPVLASVGAGKDTPASDGIIAVVDRPDPRPVWVAIWGGSADLAQALWKVRRTRPPDELERFVSRLRVHMIADQDATGPWIRENFPGLFVISNQRAMRGMYRGGDVSLTGSAWVQRHIKGHGALGDLYPDYDGGDIWSRTLGRVRGIKEGDSPSFLYLVPNGLGDPERPWLGSWGGRFEGRANRYADVPGEAASPDDPDPRMVTVYRWRAAFQADFQARLEWCIQPYEAANHPPNVQVAGPRERVISPGAVVELDARGTSDPDGDDLGFTWTIDPAANAANEPLAVADPAAPVIRLAIPPTFAGGTIAVVLTVQDQGSPPLTRYARVLISVDQAR